MNDLFVCFRRSSEGAFVVLVDAKRHFSLLAFSSLTTLMNKTTSQARRRGCFTSSRGGKSSNEGAEQREKSSRRAKQLRRATNVKNENIDTLFCFFPPQQPLSSSEKKPKPGLARRRQPHRGPPRRGSERRSPGRRERVVSFAILFYFRFE